MKRQLLTAIAAVTAVVSTVQADVYELRVYTTNEGKLDDLHARFRDHTIKIFKRHGMESVGYWVPQDEPNSKNTLIYVLRHKSRDAAKASWKAFISDPEWMVAFAASRTDGPLLSKAPKSVFMEATDYNPKFKNDKAGGVFELRTYTTNEDKLKGLDSRFRDHTMKLFEKHGIKNVAYWHPTDKPASENQLIYIIRHDSREAAGKSWKAFGSDPEWKKVARESQKDGRFLSKRPESVYMKSTDYSAIK